MKYNELVVESKKQPNRVGRGISAGQGKTAGRGTKGQGARKSGGVRPGFEGGQMPLYMRLPKLRGFKSQRPKPEVIYTGQLENIKKTTITAGDLAEKGLISSVHADIKLLVKGELTTKKDVKLPYASQSAIKVLQNSSGSFTKTSKTARQKKTDKSDE